LPGGQRFQEEGGGEGIGNALGSLLAGFAGKGANKAIYGGGTIKDPASGETPPLIDNEPFARGQGVNRGGAMTRQERLQNMPPEAMQETTLIAEEPTADTAPTFLPKEKRPSDALYAEIERRQGKDFKGKDKDTDHNILDVLKSAGLGALQSLASADPRQGWEGMLGSAVGGAGAGVVGGSIDPTTDERIGNEMNLAKLLPQYQQQFGLETQRDDVDQKNRKQEADIAIAEATPGLRADEARRKRAADQAKAENAKAILADKAKGRELTGRQIDDLARYRDFLIENGTKKTDATLKQIEERLKDYDLDRKSREDIARMNVAGRSEVAGINANQRNIATQVKSADQARKTLAGIAKFAPKDATPEQIKAKEQEFLATLSPELRLQLNQ
jgi:hypothetical protein